MENEPKPLFSMECEMSCLGSILLSSRAQKELCEKLCEEDFYRPAHRIIFRELRKMWIDGLPPDAILLENRLIDSGQLADIGGPDYLLEIAAFTPSAANSAWYSDVVQEKSILRKLDRTCREAIREIWSGSPSGEIRRNLEQLTKAMEIRGVDFAFVSEVDDSGDDLGVPTGYPSLDAHLAVRGWPRGQMSVVCAQEKAGKSTLMIGSCAEACRAGLSVCYATFADLNQARIKRRLKRYLCGYSTLESASRDGREEEFLSADDEVNSWNLQIYDGSKSSAHRDIDRFLSKIEQRQETKSPFDQAFIDYGQKLTTKNASAANQVALGDYCSDVISACAERTSLPIIVGSQLTQGNSKEGRDPMTKGSRKWLEDCGVALLIESGEVNARSVTIFRSRFGGMGTMKAFRFDEFRLKFEAVNTP